LTSTNIQELRIYETFSAITNHCRGVGPGDSRSSSSLPFAAHRRHNAVRESTEPHANGFIAGANGFPGRTVTRPSQLRQALEEAVKEPGPYLLNVQVTPFENVYPMVPAGGAVNEMVLGPPQPVEVA